MSESQERPGPTGGEDGRQPAGTEPLRGVPHARVPGRSGPPDAWTARNGLARQARHGRIGRQRQLPLRKAARIAWQNIRVRLVRSLLVTSGIILAIAFLTYVLCSDGLMQQVVEKGQPELLEALERGGVLAASDQERPGLSGRDARIQTRWMVGLALLVSFVGVLNAMVLSVTERFREIGTMKCLGALNGLIVELFLLESTFQGMVGTGAGIAIGLALTLVEGMGLYGRECWSLLPVGTIAAIVGICFVAGTLLTIAGSLYPALVAARMQPVEALRSEV